ncbi:MAG: diadenylate cyclase CdaA [Tidjanibacter sp.]|nr:diadenylate cyclase CdaA [Tidjanibacter sp.]
MGFINITIVDVIDIVAVAVIIYYLYRLIRGTNATSILTGLVLIYIVWVVVKALNMEMMSAILGGFVSVGIIALIVIFQPEIRKFLQTIGDRGHSRNKDNFLSRIFNSKKGDDRRLSMDENVNPIVKACDDMSAGKTGALIVIRQSGSLDDIIATGVKIDGVITDSLLKNLFFKNSPLHDGAVVIDGNRIVAAKCVLPSTHSEVPLSFGMRHRAALGISEESDAIIIVVSEETGGISIAHNGKIQSGLSSTEMKAQLIGLQHSSN